jgi:soluble lytic murein transglycosylase-like protein
MKRLLLSACLAGLAISGAGTGAKAAETAAETANTAGADTLAAADKPIFPIFPRSTAAKATAIKTVSLKTSAKPIRVPLPLPRPPEADIADADANGTDGAAQQPTQAVADATPAETQASDAPAPDAPDPKAAEAQPKHMNTGHPQIDSLVATHARANNVPEALIHRVIVRESKYQKDLVGSCGCIGLMQIKLGTARGLGYSGDAQGLHDANTNLTYGVKYLAGAYRVAHGDHDRTVHYFARGYYEEAKRQRFAEARPLAKSETRTEAKLEHAHAPLDLIPKQPRGSAAKRVAARSVEAQAQPPAQ